MASRAHGGWLSHIAGKGDAIRATRLPLRVPVAFRAAGSASWQRAMSVNVSRSGVLMELEACASDVPAGDVEFVLGLAVDDPTTAACNVRCYGRVVRRERGAGGRRIAVTIDRFAAIDSERPADSVEQVWLPQPAEGVLVAVPRVSDRLSGRARLDLRP